MKLYIFILLMLQVSVVIAEENFQESAKTLSLDLKRNLLEQLSKKISEVGAAESIGFCKTEVGPIVKGIAGERAKKFNFGRTSLKLRNPNNKPQDWMIKYLQEFENKNEDKGVLHTFENGEQAFLGPIYVQAVCLQCHGENLSSAVKSKLNELYPQDKATGYKLGQFRGFVWIKAK